MHVYRHNNMCMSIDMVIENSELKSAISRDNLLLIFHSIPGASRTRDEGIEKSDNRKTAFFCIIRVTEKV